jgi:hypothetical protein
VVHAVDVAIVRWVDDHQPGFVECQLTDMFGTVWRFIEKLPVVSSQLMSAASSYPQTGVIACQVIKLGRDAVGREIVEIDTISPWGVQAVDGTTRFQVYADQVIELSDH